MKELRLLSGHPRSSGWLEGAVDDAVDFLRRNVTADDVIVYASLGHVYIHAVLAPLRQLKDLEAAQLARTHVQVDDCWRTEHVWGGEGKPDRVYLDAPLSNAGPLRGGEKLVYLRQWAGSDGIETEISQKLVHAVDVHFVEERGAYCRVDEAGDLEDVINLYHDDDDDFRRSARVVCVRRRDLEEFAVLASMGIVVRFDFNRYTPRDRDPWSDVQRSQFDDRLLSYEAGVQKGFGSFVYGHQIHLPRESKRQIAARRRRMRTRPKKYASFKVLDLVTGKQIETSCDPARLSSYFESETKVPRTMSPVFFSGEVLHKYKADSAKYELTDREISCRASWHLTTYDVNSAGQVHTYIGYLGDLPYEEQLYWRSFNEWPDGPLSERAVKNDFLGEFADLDPLQSIKHKIECLDQERPEWWCPRGRDMMRAVQIPATSAENEWSEALLAFDHLVVEGFNDKALRGRARETGRQVEKNWRSIKLLEECLLGSGVGEEKAKEAMKSFREAHDHRTIAKGHSARGKKSMLKKEALRTHGSFRQHFTDLVTRCDATMNLIMKTMGITLE